MRPINELEEILKKTKKNENHYKNSIDICNLNNNFIL